MAIDPPARWRLRFGKSHAFIKQTVDGSARDVLTDFLFPYIYRTADHAPTADEALYWDESGILQLLDTGLPTGAVALGFDDIIYLAPSVPPAYSGTSSVGLTVGITATGAVRGTVSVPLSFGTTASGAATGTASVPLTFAVTGTSRTSGTSTVSETFSITATGTVSGTVSIPLTVTTTATGQATGTVSVPLTFGVTASGLAVGANNVTVAETFSVTATGAGTGGSTVALSFGVTASGAVSMNASSTVSSTVAITATGVLIVPVYGDASPTLTVSITADGVLHRLLFSAVPQDFKRGRRYGTQDSWWVPQTVGVTVWRKDGVWYAKSSPPPWETEGADRIYLGGRTYEIGQSEAADLVAAGFGSGVYTN